MKWAVLDILADDSARCAGEVSAFLRDRAAGRLLVLRLGGPFDLSRHLPALDPEEPVDPGAPPAWVALGVVVAPNGRPVRSAWVREIRDACRRARVPFYFAGWGKYLPHDQAHHHDHDAAHTPIPEGFHAESALWRVPEAELLPLLDGEFSEVLPAALPLEWERLWKR
ncbi:MAG: DUF5131 family protein [Rhodocyclaceae bacterium]|nr:MAG: DUF5131 family protein [Rhodocyclaceae bacterium]